MIIAVRLMVVLTFLVGMPLLALPQIATWCETQLYPPTALRRPLANNSPAVPTRLVSPPDQVIERPVAQIDHLTSAIEPASFTHPFESSVHAAPPEFKPEPSARDPLADHEQIGRLEAELQRLGATFYRLEAPQAPNLPFHFVAQFERRVAGLPERFQVTTSHLDPLVAMRQMVEQVESRTSVARP